MKTDFSKDVIASFGQFILNLKPHQVFDQEALERSIDKLCLLRMDPEYADKKIIGMYFVGKVDLPIKKKVITKCFLTTDSGETLTDTIELVILSIEEARKCPDSSDEIAKYLRFMGADTYEERNHIADGNEMLLKVNECIEEYIHSKEFEEAMKKEGE